MDLTSQNAEQLSGMGNGHQQSSNGSTSGNLSQGNGGHKGNKGIRNRVFCGECGGCLKNDDCGKCRYCKDKTKFGGQNRLRQKCLHRRCQVSQPNKIKKDFTDSYSPHFLSRWTTTGVSPFTMDNLWAKV